MLRRRDDAADLRDGEIGRGPARPTSRGPRHLPAIESPRRGGPMSTRSLTLAFALAAVAVSTATTSARQPPPPSPRRLAEASREGEQTGQPVRPGGPTPTIEDRTNGLRKLDGFF